MRPSTLNKLLKPLGPQPFKPALPPTMTPLEAQLFDLARVARKAAEGLDGPGPALRGGVMKEQILIGGRRAGKSLRTATAAWEHARVGGSAVILCPKLPPPPPLQQHLDRLYSLQRDAACAPGVRLAGEYHYEFTTGGHLRIMTPEQLAKGSEPWTVALLEVAS